MNRIFLVTGAFGHLGNTIIKKLINSGEKVRGLILPTDKSPALSGLNVSLYKGDICDPSSLEPFFDVDSSCEPIVIHTAGIVSIASKYQQQVFDVNVSGTANIIKMCIKHAVKRLVYVSSVHAIPEKPKNEIMTETDKFNPDDVIGLYAKTKSEATRLVMESVSQGLDAVVVHPSGIIGPGDYGRGHTTQLVMDYLDGRLTAGINGGYDFVDVRDVADGTISAAINGKSGECYILSSQYLSVKNLLSLLHKVSGKREIKTFLPLWFVNLTAPFSELYYKLLRQPPLFTRYSLYTLNSNSRFSHKKADYELGYTQTDILRTLKDTAYWLTETGRLKKYGHKTH